MAPITTTNAVNNDAQSSNATTSSLYENLEYNSKFAGNAIQDKIVDIAVMVTDNAKSALNMEHHLFIHYEMKKNCNEISQTNMKKCIVFDMTFSYSHWSHNSYQFEYDPPGLLVTTNNVIPMASFN